VTNAAQFAKQQQCVSVTENELKFAAKTNTQSVMVIHMQHCLPLSQKQCPESV